MAVCELARFGLVTMHALETTFQGHRDCAIDDNFVLSLTFENLDCKHMDIRKGSGLILSSIAPFLPE